MDKVKYVNHLGETLDLRSTGIMSSYLALKNFVQSMTNNRLTSEGKSVALPVVCLTKKDANRLIDTLEKDSTQNIYGKFYVNDWYIRVIYQGMTIIGEYGDKVKMEISFYAEETIFTKETSYQLLATSTISGNGLNFPFNFPFNFGADPIASASVTNNELLDADFVLKLDKPTSDISISIDANSYIVNGTINEGETFVLDTAEKEVYKLTSYGKVSLLGAADDASYIFNPISNGQHKVTWNGDFSLFLTLLERRRTPIWI
jgi:phage-related protein